MDQAVFAMTSGSSAVMASAFMRSTVCKMQGFREITSASVNLQDMQRKLFQLLGKYHSHRSFRKRHVLSEWLRHSTNPVFASSS